MVLHEAHKIVITMPEDLADSLPESDTDLQQEIKRYLAVKFFQQSAMTIGQAAKFAGLNKTEFETYLSVNQFPISFLNFTDIDADLKKMARIKRTEN
jgi:predicted HTH domain antitoxin